MSHQTVYTQDFDLKGILKCEKGRDVAIPNLDIPEDRLSEHLWSHLQILTEEIGERSIFNYANLKRASEYIGSTFTSMKYIVQLQEFTFMDEDVENIIAVDDPSKSYERHYLICAHYDTVLGTPGADDNASGVAVLLELARLVKQYDFLRQGIDWRFAAFTTEEPPAFSTAGMGSRVYARKAKRDGEKIDGVICLEMVGYYTDEEKSQHFPFPLQFMGYPTTGNFIAVVGNRSSKGLTKGVVSAFDPNPRLPVESLTAPANGYLLRAVRLSDHSSFWDEGYKAVMLTDTAFYRNSHYHGPGDTLETLNLSAMAELVKGLFHFVRNEATLISRQTGYETQGTNEKISSG
jgi:hypothetical protein